MTTLRWDDKELVNAVGAAAARDLFRVGAAMESDIKRSFGSSGAKFTKSGDRRYATKTERHGNRSKPGEPPHVDTGTLRRSITHQVVRTGGPTFAVCRVGSNIEYSKWLELGTSRMAARPFLRPSLARMLARIRAGEFFKASQ